MEESHQESGRHGLTDRFDRSDIHGHELGERQITLLL
jgi:hypothetical protein